MRSAIIADSFPRRTISVPNRDRLPAFASPARMTSSPRRYRRLFARPVGTALPNQSSIRRLSILDALACLLAVLVATCIGCQKPDAYQPTALTTIQAPAGSTTATAAGTKPNSAKVTPVAVEMRPWPAIVRLQGSLMADETTVIGAKVAGRIKQVKVDLGTVVQSGDVVAQLDSEEFDLRVVQAEAQLEQQRAKVGLKPGQPDTQLNREKAPTVLQEKAVLDEAREAFARTESLFEQKTATTAELQQREALFRVAEARFAAALNGVDEQIALLSVRKAELALAKELQAESVIRAPFTCVVQERRVAPGTYVKVGDPIVELVRTDPLRFRGGVPEREALQVAVGQLVRVLLDDGEQTVEARVSRISPALDMASRALTIEVDIPNPGAKLRAGLFAEAEVVIDPDQEVLSVPTTAISEFAGVERVWIVESGQLKERRIQTGRRKNGWIEVLDGLQASDRIASNARAIRGGEAVEDDVELAGREHHGHGQSE